jgi:hypothetical protein
VRGDHDPPRAALRAAAGERLRRRVRRAAGRHPAGPGARGQCYDELHKAGRRDKFVVRFAEDFRAYDARRLPDVSSTEINFTVLDGRPVLHATDDDTLEIFPRR